MSNNKQQNQVKYLWIPDERNDTTMSGALAKIMNDNDGKIYYEHLEEKLCKKFNCLPIMILVDNLHQLFKNHEGEDSLPLYPFIAGIVYNKTTINRYSLD